jgi:hypothetical protein
MARFFSIAISWLRHQPTQRNRHILRPRRLSVERLEERTPLALTMVQEPRLQLGDAALNATTDELDVLWQTSGVNDQNDQFTLEYKLPAQTWQNATRAFPAGSTPSLAA